MAADLASLSAEVAELRRLAADDPDCLYPRLAFALAELSSGLLEAGRRGESLQAAEEAAREFRLLAEHDESFREGLAGALTSLCGRRLDCGDDHGAMEAGSQAVDLAATIEGEDGPLILASARLNLAAAALSCGAVEEASGVLRETGRAVRRLLEGGARDQGSFLFGFLRRCADEARDQERWPAHLAWQRAVTEALPGDPPAARAVLGHTLDQTAEALAESDLPQAVRLAEEAAGLFAALPKDYAGPLPEVARRWLHLAITLDDYVAIGRAAEAVANAFPAGDEHAGALAVLAMAHEAGGRSDEAIACAEAAAAYWRGLPSLAAEMDGALLLDALRRQARLLAGAGRAAEALAVAEDGLRLCLDGVMQAGLGDPAAFAEFQRLRADCLKALGRDG